MAMSPELGAIDTPIGPRADALARWRATGWPGGKSEAWRFTSLDRLAKARLTPADAAGKTAKAGAKAGAGAGAGSGAGAGLAAQLDAHLVGFVNGVVDESTLKGLPAGISLGRLAEDAPAQARLAEIAPAGHPVSDLSLAVMSSGLVLDVSGRVDKPIFLMFEGEGAGLCAHPVILVRLADGARLEIAEYHNAGCGLSAPLAGFEIGRGAHLDHVKVQNDRPGATHLAASGAVIEAKGRFRGFALCVGAGLARLETHVRFAGEDASCELSAIYMGRAGQHHDITTFMDHAKPNCVSDQHIRGVLDDDARGVYQGRVRVAPDAQKSDGRQMSRALLLSARAEADAKPELEIHADDVVCAHGATVGELDRDQLFYLTSRGIPDDQARAMLVRAFLIDTIDSFENERLAGLLRPAAETWLDVADAAGARRATGSAKGAKAGKSAKGAKAVKSAKGAATAKKAKGAKAAKSAKTGRAAGTGKR